MCIVDPHQVGGAQHARDPQTQTARGFKHVTFPTVPSPTSSLHFRVFSVFSPAHVSPPPRVKILERAVHAVAPQSRSSASSPATCADLGACASLTSGSSVARGSWVLAQHRPSLSCLWPCLVWTLTTWPSSHSGSAKKIHIGHLIQHTNSLPVCHPRPWIAGVPELWVQAELGPDQQRALLSA